MASKITAVYARHWSSPMFRGQDVLPFNPFVVDDNSFLKVITDELDSVNLSKLPGPYIVIAGSGMCDAGRVRNHLRQGLSCSKTSVCLVGYMAKNTLGRRLKDYSPKDYLPKNHPLIKMNDITIKVKANIVSFDSFSAHADSPFLVDFSRAIVSQGHHKTKAIFLIHGEKERAIKLRWELNKSFKDLTGKLPELIIPKIYDTQRIS
jgi:metallo-beta-lactamase family protein